MNTDPQATELAELREQVARLTEQCADARRELEAFTYAISHDLRAPLRSLSGFSQALLELPAQNFDPKAAHYLERVQQAGRKMSEMIDALLTLSRVSRADLQCRIVDFTQLCSEAAVIVRARFPEHPLRVTIQENMTAFGDSRQLRLLAEVLLDNSFKFTSGRSQPTAAISMDAALSGPVLRFSDNGIGFDMTYAEKLFRPFQRLHADPKFSGLGMGLATAHRIVARHNGKIWAHGRPDQGTEFFVTLAPAAGI